MFVLWPGFCFLTNTFQPYYDTTESGVELLFRGGRMDFIQKEIPSEFLRTIPKGFRLMKRNKNDLLLIESVLCPRGHNLIDDKVRVHDEPSIKLKVTIDGISGYLFIDAFWGSHTKLFSFMPAKKPEDVYVQAFCPHCDADLGETFRCSQKECRSNSGILLLLPGGRNKIHVCSKLDCPGHVLDINDMPHELIESISAINFFGAGADDILGGLS